MRLILVSLLLLLLTGCHQSKDKCDIYELVGSTKVCTRYYGERIAGHEAIREYRLKEAGARGD